MHPQDLIEILIGQISIASFEEDQDSICDLISKFDEKIKSKRLISIQKYLETKKFVDLLEFISNILFLD